MKDQIRNGGVEEPFIVDPKNNFQDISQKEKKTNCCKFTWKRCGIASGVIFLIIVLIIGAGALRFYASMTGTATSKDSDKWNKTLQDDETKLGEIHLLKSIIDGEFSLASFEDNYEEFLIGMGMPQIIAVMVSGSKEIVTFIEPRKGKQEWKKKVVTDFSDDEASFVMGSRFYETTGSKKRKTTFDTLCTLSGSRNNVMECKFKSIDEKATEIESISTFSRLGYVEKRTLVKMGISTTKYFKRLSLLEVANDFEDEKLNEKLKQAEEDEKMAPKDDFEDFKK